MRPHPPDPPVSTGMSTCSTRVALDSIIIIIFHLMLLSAQPPSHPAAGYINDELLTSV